MVACVEESFLRSNFCSFMGDKMLNSIRKFLFILMAISLVATSAHAEDDEGTRRFYLNDGSSVRGVVISETEDTFIVRSSLGELTIRKADLRIRYARFILKDTTVLLGKLLDEGEFYLLETSLGIVKIEKDRVESFEVQFGAPGSTEGSTNIGELFGKVPGKKEEMSKGFGHSIEPLIDIFFDPTGYVFKKGDLYISGLSLAYGFSDSWLLSVNLVSLTGIPEGDLNPNLEAKLNLVDHRDGALEYLLSVGTKLGTFEHVGNWEVTYVDDVETSRIKRRRWRDAWHNEEEFNEGTNEENGEPDNRNRIETEDETGWQSKFYLAQSLSILLERGGRLGLHLGGQFELNSFNYDELDNPKRQSYRFHFGFDIDLSRRFKLLGEIFYDPDREFSVWTDGPVGADFGLMFAFTQNFRMQFHLQPMFLGLYWRL